MLTVELRDNNSLHIEGYVNAVGRDSTPINAVGVGRCVEQVEAGAFGAAIANAPEIRMLLNHDNDKQLATTTDNTLSLTENNIGLYAKADITNENVIAMARKGELRGWSFGFMATEQEIEKRENNIPRRHIKALELYEVSLLDSTHRPAYDGTLIEVRAADGELIEYRSVEGVEVKEKEKSEDEPEQDQENAAETDTDTEDTDTDTEDTDTDTEDTDTDTEDTDDEIEQIREEHRSRRERLNALKRAKRLVEMRAFYEEVEERYNPYHVPAGSSRGGQFTSANGGGMGGVVYIGQGLKGRYGEYKQALGAEDAAIVMKAMSTGNPADVMKVKKRLSTLKGVASRADNNAALAKFDLKLEANRTGVVTKQTADKANKTREKADKANRKAYAIERALNDILYKNRMGPYAEVDDLLES